MAVRTRRDLTSLDVGRSTINRFLAPAAPRTPVTLDAPDLRSTKNGAQEQLLASKSQVLGGDSPGSVGPDPDTSLDVDPSVDPEGNFGNFGGFGIPGRGVTTPISIGFNSSFRPPPSFNTGKFGLPPGTGRVGGPLGGGEGSGEGDTGGVASDQGTSPASPSSPAGGAAAASGGHTAGGVDSGGPGVGDDAGQGGEDV